MRVCTRVFVRERTHEGKHWRTARCSSSDAEDTMTFFDRVAYRIGPAVYSLDDIEHGVLRNNSPHPARIPSSRFGSPLPCGSVRGAALTCAAGRVVRARRSPRALICASVPGYEAPPLRRGRGCATSQPWGGARARPTCAWRILPARRRKISSDCLRGTQEAGMGWKPLECGGRGVVDLVSLPCLQASTSRWCAGRAPARPSAPTPSRT